MYRPVVRRRPLLRTAAVATTVGAGYYAGKKSAQSAQQMQDLQSQVQETQQQVQETQDMVAQSSANQPAYPPQQAMPYGQPMYPPQQAMPYGQPGYPPQQGMPYAQPGYPPTQAAPPDPSSAPASAPGAANTPDRVTQLKQLDELRQSGALTDEEFQQEKQRILSGQ